MARVGSLRIWLALAFLLGLGAVEWHALRALFDPPQLAHVPVAHLLDVWVADYEWFGFFAYLILPAIVVGVVASFVATALEPARVRGLLNDAQCWQFGSLATLALCIAQTGLFWAHEQQDQLGSMVWSVALAMAYQVFTVVSLMVAVRAASAVQPLRAGLQLVGGAIGTFLAAVGAGVILLLFLQDREPTLPVYGLITLVWIALLILPPAILTCGVAALVTEIRGRLPGTRRPGIED